MRAVLLPGLDGCAGLREEFVAALAPEIETAVIALPGDVELGYDGLVAHAQARLPREPFLLIGESFSGPTAIKLAAKRPEGLAGLVLCATFARAPYPARALVRRLVAHLPVHAAPMPLVMQAMMGRWSTPAWSRRLREALAGVEQAVLRRRIVEVMVVDATNDLSQVACPILCLDAGSDRVLWFGRRTSLAKARPDARHVSIAGPHMLLQAAPMECAEQIKRLFAA